MNFIKERFNHERLAYISLTLTTISLLLVYYQIEPSPADIVITAAVVAAGISFLLARKLSPFSLIDLPILLYLAYVLVQLLIQWDSIDVRFGLITLYLGSTYYLVKYLVARLKRSAVDKIWLAYIVGAIFTSLLMMWQMVDVYSLGGEVGKLYFGRPNGWFKDANVAGPFLLPIAFFAFYTFLKNKKTPALILFAIVSVGVLLSFSRGAYLGYICGNALIYLLALIRSSQFNWQSVKNTSITAAVPVVLVAVVWGFMNLYSPFHDMTMDRFGTFIKPYDTQGRAVSWQAGLEGFKAAPLGIGSGGYEKQSYEYQKSLQSDDSEPQGTDRGEPDEMDRDDLNRASGSRIKTSDGENVIITPSAHNTYIRVLLENGAVGFTLLVAGWLVLAILGARTLWTKRGQLPAWLDTLLIVSFTAYLAFLAMGTFIDTLHWRFLWLVAGLIAGACYLAVRHQNGDKPTKVLQVIQPTDGGSALHVRQLIEGLLGKGVAVELAATSHPEYVSLTKKQGIRYHQIAFKRSMNPLHDIMPMLQLREIALREQFQVIHLHSTKAGLIGRLAVAGLDTKVVYTPHSPLYFQYHGFIKQVFYWAERLTIALVDTVILVSPSEKDRVVSDKMAPTHKCRVVVNGIDLPTTEKKLPKHPVITMVSRLESQKRHQDLIHAAPLIIKKYPNIEIRLIGDGSRRQELDQIINELEVSENVKLLGARTDIEEQWASSTIAVQCSETEGLPYTVLEAMAAGLPVVGTRVEGIVDLVKDNHSGLLYDRGDSSQLAKQVIVLLGNSESVRRFGQRGKAVVKSDYTLKVMIDRIANLYINVDS